MSINFVKFIVSSVLKNGSYFDVFITNTDDKYNVTITINTEDMKKIMQYRGKLYRAIKMLLRCYFKKDFVNIVINLQDEK